jgi:hypothetical protein
MMPMVFVKSILAGIAALMLVATIVIGILALMLLAESRLSGSSGIYALSFGVNEIILWICGALIFGAGFWWEFQRLKLTHSAKAGRLTVRDVICG